MKKIGILFGVENSFPSALVERINVRSAEGAHGANEICAEFVLTGAVNAERAAEYAVIVDRISHDVPFYRAMLKQAAVHGTVVINDPMCTAADDKFHNYALARKLGVAIPATVLLPHKELPNATSTQSMRNLEFPLDWESIFAAAGEHGFLKPIDGGGGRDVHEVRGREEFFRAYDQSRDLCMVFQKAIEFTEYYRLYVVGSKTVRVMEYDPRRPHAERYSCTPARAMTFHARKLFKRMQEDAVKLCRALGYGLNTVEFAVENGVPYAIDFMNPVPDADVHSVGEMNFEWIVEETAKLAMARARKAGNKGTR
jgi:glutathione synthase/RimK-type ligase-like ATP-grasp enzyme